MNELFYCLPNLSAVFVLGFALLVGVLTGIGIGVLIGIKIQQRREPKLWTDLRWYKAEAGKISEKNAELAAKMRAAMNILMTYESL